MTQNVGEIEYTIKADTLELLTADRQVVDVTNNMERGFSKADKSVNTLSRSFGKLSAVAASLLAALSAQQVASYADAWTELNNKLANSVRANEQLIDVTQRVFDIAQATRAGLGATASLYAKLERSTRAYGTSVEDVAKLTTIINQGFVVSGATAEEAAGAVLQLSQGLGSGVLRGDEFNAVMESGNRIAVALADSLGVTVAQLRNMAAEGKLTTDVVVNGLLSQGSVIGQEFSKTISSISQTLQIAGNNLTKYFGESTTVKAGVAAFNSAVISVSENIDVVSTALAALAIIMGGRYVSALTMATAQAVQNAMANQQQARAEALAAAAAEGAANAAQRKAVADKEAAMSALALAQAEYNVAKGSAAEMLAMDALIAAKSRASAASLAVVEAENAQAAASLRAGAAARAASVGLNLAKGALALIGGPAGAAMLAGAAIFYFWQQAEEARQKSLALADSLDTITAKMREMNQAQLQGTMGDLNTSIRAQVENLAELKSAHQEITNQLYNARQAMNAATEGSNAYASASAAVAELEEKVATSARDIDTAETKLSQTKSTLGLVQAQYNGTLEQGIDLLRRDGQEAGVVSGLMKQLGDSINFAAKAKEKFNSASLKVERPKGVQDFLDKQLEQIDLQSELNDRKREQLKAEQDIRRLGGSENDVNLARERAGAEYDAQKAQEERRKAEQKAAQDSKRAASSAESVAQKLARLQQEADLSAGSTEELSREQAILNAQQSLGKAATESDIQLAGELAAKKWDLVNSIKAQAAAEKLIPETRENVGYQQDVEALNTALDAKKITQEQYNTTSENLEQQHQVNLAKIRAQQVVSPKMSAAGEIDPVQKLANENAVKLALIQQYEQAGIITHEQALAQKNALDNQYEQQRLAALEQQYRAQSQLNDFTMGMIDTLGQRAGNMITGLITGTQSASDAMRSLAATILNEAVGALIQMGIQALKNMVIGETAAATSTAMAAVTGSAMAAAYAPAAAMASLASFGANAAPAQAGIASTMALTKGLSLAGGRRYGGGVSAGNAYRVNESGQSEIFQTAGGQQAFIPNKSGKVIPADEAGGGAVSPVNIVINNMASGTTVENQGYNPDTKTINLAVKEVARQLRSRTGDIPRALNDSWNVTGKTQ